MKKNWMKLLALALSTLMVLSLFAACGMLDSDDDDDDVRGTVSQAAQNDTIASQDPAGDTTAAQNITPETTGSDEKEFSIGSTATGSYENAFIGIGCALPAGWTFYTDDQIKQQNQATAGMLEEEYAEMISSAAVIYDMMAVDGTGSSVNVNMEKVNAVALAMLDLEDYLNNNTAMLVDALGSAGITVTETKIVDVDLAGQARKGLWLKCSYSGMDMYEVLTPIKCGSYIANVTVATFGADTTADVIDCFYAVN